MFKNKNSLIKSYIKFLDMISLINYKSTKINTKWLNYKNKKKAISN